MICVQKLTFFNSVCTLLCNSLKSPNTVDGTIKTILFSLTAAVIVILWRWEVWRREGWIRVKLQDFPAPVSTSVSDFPRMDGGAITWKFWQKNPASPVLPPPLTEAITVSMGSLGSVESRGRWRLQRFHFLCTSYLMSYVLGFKWLLHCLIGWWTRIFAACTVYSVWFTVYTKCMPCPNIKSLPCGTFDVESVPYRQPWSTLLCLDFFALTGHLPWVALTVVAVCFGLSGNSKSAIESAMVQHDEKISCQGC